MLRQNRVTQKAIIKNWNQFVDGLNQAGISHQIEKLNPTGTCNGLTYGYKLFAEQGQRTEYVQALRFIGNLRGKKEIDEVIAQYKAAKSMNAYFFPIDKVNITLDQIIDLLAGVHFGQSQSNLSQIRAMWDKNYSFFCDKAELADYLAGANLKEGESVFMSMGRHIFCIEKGASGYYLFESNAIGDEAINTEILKTEEQLAHQINSNQSCFMASSNNNLGFCMKFVSYGRKSNRALDDAIREFGDALKDYPSIKQYMDEYYQKRISRLDCALMIDEILQEGKSNDVKFLAFKDAIKNYLKSEQAFIDKQFSYNKKEINKKAYTWDLSLLSLASQNNQIMLVKRLIQDGADINIKTNQYTPLYISLDRENFEIVKVLIQAGADINIKMSDNAVTAIYIASQVGNIEIVNLLLASKAVPDIGMIASVNVLMREADSLGRRSQVEALFKSKYAGNIPEQLPGFTPLHAAIFFGHTEIVKALLQAGADVNNQASGISCLEFANAMGYQKIIAILTLNPTNTVTASSASSSSSASFFQAESEQMKTSNDNDFKAVPQQSDVTKKN